MSTTAIIVLIILGFLVLVAALLALFLPAEWKTESEITIDATQKMIFQQLNRSKNWWKGPEMEGTFSIKNSTPENHVDYLFNFDQQPYNVHASVSIHKANKQYRVIWISKLHMEQFNPLARLKGVALKMLMQEVQEKSLNRLKSFLENY